jgi:nitrate reductase gamma subunit
LRVSDYVINLILSVILIVGAYQFYFLTQRRPLRAARAFNSPFDERMP